MSDVSLIKIEAIVREEAYLDVKHALSEIGVNGITVYQVVGWACSAACQNTSAVRKLRLK